MKRVLVLVLLILIVSVGYSQKKKKKKGKKDPTYLSLTIKGGYGNSILANTNITDDSNISPDFMAPSQSFGGSYDIEAPLGKYTKDITLTSFDKILLLHLNPSDVSEQAIKKK